MAQQLNPVSSSERILKTSEESTRPLAQEMLRRVLEGNDSEHADIELLDNASGNGLVVRELLKQQSRNDSNTYKRIVIADIDPRMTEAAQKAVPKGHSEVEFMTFDQQSVPLPDGSFTLVTNNLGVFFAPNDQAALAETLRLLKPNGTAAFSTWRNIKWFHTFALPALEKSVPEIVEYLPDPSSVFPAKGWHEAETIKSKMEDAGFKNVHVEDFKYNVKVDNALFAEVTAMLIKSVAKMTMPKEKFDKYESMIEPSFLDQLKIEFPDGYWEGGMNGLIAIGKKSNVA